MRITTRGRQGGNAGGDPLSVQFLDLSWYECTLIDSWEQQEDAQLFFYWEIEKLRRYFAGLRMKDDGQWIQSTQETSQPHRGSDKREEDVAVEAVDQRRRSPTRP